MNDRTCPPNEHRVCATCLVALDWSELDGWIHPLAQVKLVDGVAGHDPIPVPLENVIEHRLRCDFCFSPEPAWTCRATSFEVDEIQMGSHEDWAACDACYAIIETGDCAKLVDRVMSESPTYGAFVGLERTIATQALTEWLGLFFAARVPGDYRGMVKA